METCIDRLLPKPLIIIYKKTPAGPKTKALIIEGFPQIYQYSYKNYPPPNLLDAAVELLADQCGECLIDNMAAPRYISLHIPLTLYRVEDEKLDAYPLPLKNPNPTQTKPNL